MSNPNCNYNLPSGEFYSKKQETYQNELTENDKKFKLYSIGLYASIVIFLISLILFIILFKKNKDIINGTLNQTENDNQTQLISPWSVSVIICLIFSILSMGFGIFSGIFMAKYSKSVKKPLIDDETRPCYSKIKKEVLTGISSQQTQNAPVPVSSISGNITGSQTGQATGTQTIQSGTTITGSGLDQLKGLEINTQSGESSSIQEGGTRNVLNNVGTGGSFTLDQNQTSQNSAGITSSISGNASSNPENVVSGNATSSSTNNSSVTVFR